MQSLDILTSEQANDLLKNNTFVATVLVNKKILSIHNIAAFIMFSGQDFEEFKKEFSKYIPDNAVLTSFKTCTDVYSLMFTFIGNNCDFVYFYKHGVLRKNETVRNNEKKIESFANLVWTRNDNDFIFMIVRDGSPLKKNGAICLFTDERDAYLTASESGGALQNIALVAPLYDKSLADFNLFYVNGEIYTMKEIESALFLKFKKQTLPFESMIQLVKQGLSIFAGEENGELIAFKQMGCSTFFTRDIANEDLPIGMRNAMPMNARLYTAENNETLYDYIDSKYIFINGARHTTKEIMYNAISGYDYKKQWTKSEVENKLEMISRETQLFTILDSDIIESTGRSYPVIFNLKYPTIWLFSDYGKAVMFCQNNNKYSYDGHLLIGEINRNAPGYTLLEILSIAYNLGVQGLEIDPGDEERLFISINDYFKLTGQDPLDNDRIHKVEAASDEEAFANHENVFNPMVPM